MIKIFQISGDSLYPLYKEGELVFTIHPKFSFVIKPKDIVIFTHKGVGMMIKQVRFVEKNQVFVEGTSLDSLDSRAFGTIPINKITHKILFKIPSMTFKKPK